MNFLFGRNFSENVVVKPEIRPSFAKEILDLEVEFNLSPSIPLLQRLMELYTEGIEHYEPLKNPKFVYYNSKLKDLLSRSEVISLTQDQKKSASLQFDRSSEKTLQNHQSETISISNQIKDNLKTQSESLNSRLEKRKRRNINKKKAQISQYDKGGGPNPVEDFECEVEAIMERYAEEKAKARKEVQEVYQEYLDELEGSQDETMKKVIDQIKANMKTEIDQRLKELDDRRKEETVRARQRLVRFI